MNTFEVWRELFPYKTSTTREFFEVYSRERNKKTIVMKNEYAIIINKVIEHELNNIGFGLGHVFKLFYQLDSIYNSNREYTFILLMPGLLTGS